MNTSVDQPVSSIAPECALVANNYLALGCDISKTAELLGIEPHMVSDILATREVDRYIRARFEEAGLNQLDKIQTVMEEIIESKLEELREEEMTSSKDIIEILNIYHKMVMDKLTHSQKITLAQQKGPAVQKNTQVNVFGENHSKLFDALSKDPGNV